MAQSNVKLNRKGQSHAGKTMCVLTRGFFGKDKLTPTERDVFNALYSFAQKGNTADFSYSELAARYNISYPSVSRAMKKISVFFEKGEGVCSYRLKKTSRAPERYIYIPDWLHYAEFTLNGNILDLTENQIYIFSYILHQNSRVDRWNRTQAGIARDLNIAPSTVSEAISLFEALGLITVASSNTARERAANHHEKTFYKIDQKLLAEAKNRTIHNIKTLPHAVRDADERTDRERFYAERERLANKHADETKEKLGAEYKALEDELRSLALEAVKEQHKKNLLTVKEILQKHLETSRKIREFLAAHGYTEQDLKPRFICKKCSDTGFRPNGKTCDCYIPPAGGVT